MSVKIENLEKSKVVHIISKEEKLMMRYLQYSLYEDEALKIDAASEGEDEMGGLEVRRFGRQRVPHFSPIREGGMSGRRSFASGEGSLSNFTRKKDEIRMKFYQPPTFKDSRVYKSNDKWVIEIDFERLGKMRRLKIETPELSWKYLKKILREQLPRECLYIPWPEPVIKSLTAYVKELVKSKGISS